MNERVQKYLASAGYGSRREIEKWLEAGQITTSQGVLKPGDRVEAGQVLYVHGKRIVISELKHPTRMLVYHKAEGEITTHKDPGKRRRVFDSLPSIENGRWLSVGRLDVNTTGLMLFSNDGELVNALMHPSSEVEREYLCRVYGPVSDDSLKRLCEGVQVGNDLLQFRSIEPEERTGSNQWFRIVLTGGKNREIRRAWQAFGCEVSRLKRVRYGHFHLPRHLKV
ncbi:MAG: pseudouridine synthase, partial [Gammaproteobacteria bacterium]|nr:pseudouridine synthase [Gammaproteobacteria bacterium]